MKWCVSIISAPRRGNETINARCKRRSIRLRINPPRAARTTADRSAGPRRYRLFVHSFSLDRSIITSSALKRDGGLPPLKITLSAAYHGDIAAMITVKVAVLNFVQLLRRSVQVSSGRRARSKVIRWRRSREIGRPDRCCGNRNGRVRRSRRCHSDLSALAAMRELAQYSHSCIENMPASHIVDSQRRGRRGVLSSVPAYGTQCGSKENCHVQTYLGGRRRECHVGACAARGRDARAGGARSAPPRARRG